MAPPLRMQRALQSIGPNMPSMRPPVQEQAMRDLFLCLLIDEAFMIGVKICADLEWGGEQTHRVAGG